MAKRALYSEKKDKPIDAKLLKGLTPAQRKAFEAADKKHPKYKYQDQDTARDKKIIKQVKKKVK